MEDRKHSPLPWKVDSWQNGRGWSIRPLQENGELTGHQIACGCACDKPGVRVYNDPRGFEPGGDPKANLSLIVRSVNLSDKYEAIEKAAREVQISLALASSDGFKMTVPLSHGIGIAIVELGAALRALQEAKKSLPKED